MKKNFGEERSWSTRILVKGKLIMKTSGEAVFLWSWHILCLSSPSVVKEILVKNDTGEEMLR